MDPDYYSQAAQIELIRRYRSGVKWFYWIAGLSVVTSIIAMSGGHWSFIISLGTTQFIDGIAKGSRWYPRVITSALWLDERGVA